MPADIGSASLALTQALGSFGSFLPPLREVRKGNPREDPELTKDVRTGELAAAAVTLAVGAVMSSLTQDPTPAVVALVISVTLIAVYECTLRHGTPKGNQA